MALNVKIIFFSTPNFFIFVLHLFIEQRRRLDMWTTKQGQTPTVASKFNYHSVIITFGVL